jgi:hypothetical protein
VLASFKVNSILQSALPFPDLSSVREVTPQLQASSIRRVLYSFPANLFNPFINMDHREFFFRKTRKFSSTQFIFHIPLSNDRVHKIAVVMEENHARHLDSATDFTPSIFYLIKDPGKPISQIIKNMRNRFLNKALNLIT